MNGRTIIAFGHLLGEQQQTLIVIMPRINKANQIPFSKCIYVVGSVSLSLSFRPGKNDSDDERSTRCATFVFGLRS